MKISQNEFVERVGSSATILSETENNKNEPGFELLYNIAKNTDISLYYLFYGTNPMFQKGSQIQPVQQLFAGVKLSSFELNFLNYFAKSHICRFQMLSVYKQLIEQEDDEATRELPGKKKK